MNNFIPVNEPLFEGNEKKYLTECIDKGWISSEGPYVAEFEKQFCASVGRKFGISVCNGTAALEVAVKVCDVGKGDEVIMPTFTIISCVLPIIRAGAVPVFVDCDLRTWNMDVGQIEKKITKKTKAIMVVHIYGLPVDMDPVLKIAEKYKLKIIEDAAEMHGQEYKGKKCGSFGDVSIFSFYANKIITTGEGGMILTDSPLIAERCRSYRNLCFQKERRFVHKELGWNYRMSNLQAAVGLAQLEQLQKFIKIKRNIGNTYTELLSNVKDLELPSAETEYSKNIYWVFGVILKDNLPFQADDIMRRLFNKGVGTRPFFWPLHKQPVFNQMGLFKKETYPRAERLSKRGFYLPSGLALTDKEIRMVVKRLKEVLS